MSVDRRILPAAQAAVVDSTGRSTQQFYDFYRRLVAEFGDLSRRLDALQALIDQLENQQPVDLSQYTRRAVNEPITGSWSFMSETEVFIDGVQQWHIDAARVAQTIPLIINADVSGVDLPVLQINQTGPAGGGFEISILDTISPGDDTGVQMGMWEGGNSSYPPVSPASGFRWRLEGDVGTTGDLVFRSHETSATGQEIYRCHRNRAQMIFANSLEALPTIAFAADEGAGMTYLTASSQLVLSTAGSARLGVSAVRIRPVPPIYASDGLINAPAYAFNNDTDTGMWLQATGILAFATAGTNRLTMSSTAINGQVPWQGIAGSAATPSLSFSGDTNTGLYSAGPDQLGFSIGAVLRLTMSTTAFTATLPWRGQDGTAASPALSFSADVDTGIYRVGADQIGITAGGAVRWDVNTARVSQNIPLYLPDGSVAVPAYSFGLDTDTGIYRIGADNLGVSAGGVLRWDVDTTDIVFTLPERGPAGSAGTPTFSFSGDPNTGAFNQAADAVGIATNAVEVARFDANATAEQTRFMVFDVDSGTLARVSVGAANSAGAGFKFLRIPN